MASFMYTCTYLTLCYKMFSGTCTHHATLAHVFGNNSAFWVLAALAEAALKEETRSAKVDFTHIWNQMMRNHESFHHHWIMNLCVSFHSHVFPKSWGFLLTQRNMKQIAITMRRRNLAVEVKRIDVSMVKRNSPSVGVWDLFNYSISTYGYVWKWGIPPMK